MAALVKSALPPDSSRRTAVLVSASLAAVLGLVAMPLLAVAGFLANGWSGSGESALLSALYGAWPEAFRWSDAVTVQQTYGRPLLLVFPALLAGMTAWARGLEGESRATANVRRLVGLGFVLGALGIVTDYWLGIHFSELLWRGGFALLTLPALALLLIGSSLLGALMLRSRRSVAGFALILVLPLGLLDTAFGLRYLPAAPVFPLCAAWLVVFASALMRRDRAA